jgi:hypothetical protein
MQIQVTQGELRKTQYLDFMFLLTDVMKEEIL